MAQLARIAEAMSDPTHLEYGQHRSMEQIRDLTANTHSTANITAFLTAAGFADIQLSPNMDYVWATSPATLYPGIPTHLSPHLDFVHVYQSYHSHGSAVHRPSPPRSALAPGNLTPAFIKSHYSIETAGLDLSIASQSFLRIGQQFDPADVNAYLTGFGLPTTNISIVGPPNFGYECKTSPGMCFEASMDAELISAIAPGAVTTGWAVDANVASWFMDFVTLSNAPHPPAVNSITTLRR